MKIVLGIHEYFLKSEIGQNVHVDGDVFRLRGLFVHLSSSNANRYWNALLDWTNLCEITCRPICFFPIVRG